MELTYDWRSFQGMFYPNRKAGGLPGANTARPVYVVVEGDIIISALSENEDLSDWVGASFGEISASAKHRELIPIEREKVDQWFAKSFTLPHYYDQIESFRGSLKSELLKRKPKKDIHFRQHFLLEGILSWWGKVLPSSYGVYIRVSGQQDRDILILIRRGQVEGFHEPDLTSMGPERRRQPADVVKYLSEKYLVPVQGMFVPIQDWNEWSQSSNPWKLVARAVREERVKLAPFRWGITFLMATRAFFGI